MKINSFNSLVISTLFLLFVIGCGNSGAGNKLSYSPKEACSFLSHINGLQPSSIYNGKDLSGKDVFCSSDMKKFVAPTDNPLLLANNSHYYVEGSYGKVYEMELDLKVNQNKSAPDAQKEFANAGSDLIKKSVGVEMPLEMKKNLQEAIPGQWTIEKALLQLKKEDYDTLVNGKKVGKGYQLRFIIRPSN